MRCACLLCERSFASEAALVEHCGGVLPEPEDEPFYCTCGAVFCSPQSLASHCGSTGHAPEGADAFGGGGGSEIFGDDASDHDGGGGDDDAEPEPDGTWRCPMCGAAFASRVALGAHCGGVLPRRDEEPRWCGCGRAFCSENALMAHADALGHQVEELQFVDDDDDDRGLDYEALGRLDESVVTRGLSAAALAALAEAPAGAAFDDPITQERVARGSPAVALPCGHAFLRAPLWQWFSSSRICPVCRFELEE